MPTRARWKDPVPEDTTIFVHIDIEKQAATDLGILSFLASFQRSRSYYSECRKKSIILSLVEFLCYNIDLLANCGNGCNSNMNVIGVIKHFLLRSEFCSMGKNFMAGTKAHGYGNHWPRG